MRDLTRHLAIVSTVIFLATGPDVLAHHSAAAEYDLDKTVTVQGVVTKIEWTNPHVYVYVDVKDANGQVVNWALAGASPIALYRDGVHKDSLKIGDSVTVVGYPARTVAHLADMKSVVLADGRRVLDRSGKQ
jgi:hypothetical protein